MDDSKDFIGQARLRIESLTEQTELPSEPAFAPEDRYEIQEMLGEGAAGKVWKAYDRTLKRHVALKKLRAESSDSRERFLREARNQSRVQHPNICKVFDVGQINGEPYIAMHCVEGQTLSAASAKMTLREKVEMIRMVSEAIHAAHKSGLVHRDLKPGNILVEKNAHGWFPYITDFGLAREADSIDRTKTGMIIGTPAYMAPEQARGDVRDIDARTDVYALGATFYELLCGEPPFTGTSMEIALKTLRDDPPPLRKRNTGIPSDLEIIVLKCLEKEQQRRYYSAQALTDDLEHFLKEEPILARRPSWHYRLIKKTKKHRSILTILAIALFGVILSAAFGFYNYRAAAKRAELAQQFGQDVAEMEGFLRFAFTLPIHDVRREKSIALERMKKIEQQTKTIGSLAVGPGNYALGRGYLALHQYEKARTYLEAAWNRGYRTADVAYTLGRVTGALYQSELQELAQIANEDAKKARRQEIEKRLRDPALNYLKASKTASNASSDYLAALMAFYEDRFQDALASLAKASASAPWFYEGKKLEGDIYVSQGVQRTQSGDSQTAGKYFEKAGEAYKTAAEIARSDSTIYDAECQRLIHVLGGTSSTGAATNAEYVRAISACDLSLRVDPDNASAFHRKAEIYSDWAVTLRFHKGDPFPMYEKAIQMAKTALKLKPDYAEAWNSLGNGYVHLAYAQWDFGVERVPTIQMAIDAFQRSIRLKSNDLTFCYLGDAFSDHAAAFLEKGIDPNLSFDRSVQAYQDAIRLNPRVGAYHSNQGMTLSRKAMYQLDHGQNPTEVAKRAIADYKKAIELNPNYYLAYSNSGVTLIALGQFELSQSRDPGPFIDRATWDLRRAAGINTKNSLPYFVMTRGFCTDAEYSLQVLKNPEADLEAARKAIGKFMDLSANTLGASKELAWVELIAAEWALAQGRSAEADLKKADAALKAALKHNPEDAETYRRYARYYLVSAKERIAHKKSSDQEISRGLESINEALKRDPQYGKSYAIQGEILSTAIPIEPNADAKKELMNRAEQAFLKAFSLNQNLRGKYERLLLELRK